MPVSRVWGGLSFRQKPRERTVPARGRSFNSIVRVSWLTGRSHPVILLGFLG